MKKQVEITAPGKLMLFGEHAVIYQRPCIVTAIDQRISVKIRLRNDNFLHLNAADVGLKNYQINISKIRKSEKTPKGARFINAAVMNFYDSQDVFSGVEIETRSFFSSQFGFGSSSAVTVAVIKALAVIFGKRLTNNELFRISYKSVLNVQGVGSGYDLAASIWGGTTYFVTGGKKIIPLSKEKLPLVVGYTGIKADTPKLVRQVANLYKRNKKEVEEIFNLITHVVKKARLNVKKNNISKLGELMNINQGLLESLGVNTIELSSLIFSARRAGAYGAKLSGAGGGDCMIALVNENKKKSVEKAIESKGGKIISVVAGAPGVRIE